MIAIAVAALAAFQCPDGSPPPCRATQGASAPRRDPPLDDRAWLILPFENTSGAADVELVRQASVNLLYQELSRWSDLKVVSDDRVADLLRDVPPAAQLRWGLQPSLVMARHVGAGKLVLGDYLALGGSAQIAAKVYDVRTGQLVRTVRERLGGLTSAGGLDSLTATFGRLARSALNVPAPPGTRPGTVGTQSLVAFAEYAAGLAHYRNGFRDSAMSRFVRATVVDSTFGLPYLRLFELTRDMKYLVPPERFSDGLPARERSLLDGFRALMSGNWVQVCDAAGDLMSRDSSDAEALWMAGSCEEDDFVVEGATGPRTVRSINKAMALYRRSLELDPDQPIAFERLNSLYGTTPLSRSVCAVRQLTCPAGQAWVETLRLDGDSLASDFRRPTPPGLRGVRAPGSYALARWRAERHVEVTSRFAQANARSWLAHSAHAYALLQTGDIAGAARELDAAAYATQLPGERRLYYRDRIEVELRRERPAVAAAYLDSMFLDSTAASQPQYATAFGRFSRDQNILPESIRALVTPLRTAWTPVFAGVLPPQFDSLEARLARSYPPHTDRVRTGILRISTIAAFHQRRRASYVDTSSAEHPLVRFQGMLAAGDTARARAVLTAYTPDIRARPPFTYDDGQWLMGAESWLELGDSAAALALMQDWAERWPRFHQNVGTVLEQPVFTTSSIRLIPRAWLLFADLSRSAGQAEDARRGYRMVVGMWDRGEAPVQPLLARARAALTQLGN